MSVERFSFGNVDGREVPGFLITNGRGVRATFIAYGARLTSLHLPDRRGDLADVVLGCETLDEYVASESFFGATCGRFANRIRDGRFSLDGEEYQLTRNEGPHHLHGGANGFDRQVWSAKEQGPDGVLFELVSPDGDQGYPGEVRASVRYRLTEDALEIMLAATCDRPTIVNLAHHTYWNLAGQGSGDIRDHLLTLRSEFYLPADRDSLPTGEVRNVAGTPYDFRAAKPIGRDIHAASVDHGGSGYDHAFAIEGQPKALRTFAVLREPASGRGIEFAADAPALQVYSGGKLSSADGGKQGRTYVQFGGVALESELFPDTPNHGHFGSARLDTGGDYSHRMRFRFFVD